MMKKALVFCVVMLLSISVSVWAGEITTAVGKGADTYLSNDGQQRTGYDFTANGTHGGEPSLKVRSLVGVRMKLAYMRFDISQLDKVQQVQLGLYPVWYKGAEACTLSVYAMVNESLDNWDEMTICYNNAPGFVPFPTVPLGYYDLTSDLVKVTEMYFQKQFYTDSVYFYSEPSAAMDNFINSDTNGLVTFAVIAKDSPPGPDHDWDFGAKENSMPVAPKLVFVEAPPPVQITTADGNGADTYLSNDGQQRTGYDFTANGTHGGEPSLKVRSLVGVRMKLAYMRFDISQIGDMEQVQLGLYPVWYKGAEACTLNVYAMVNESLDNWDEMTICYNNAPGFVPFPTVPLGYYDLTGDLVKVTEMYFQKQFYTDSVYFYSEPSAAMDDFINSDTNGLVTFAVIAKDSPPGPDHDWDMGAKENSVTVAPRLIGVKKPTGVANREPDIPTTYKLSQNYPNPFNSLTTIEFTLANPGHTTLEIYNMMGQLVETLVDGHMSSGNYRISFRADTYTSGIYFYKLKSGNFTKVKKMMFLK